MAKHETIERDPKRMTNEEWFVRALNFSRGGPLVHAVLVQAVADYLSEQLSAPPPEDDPADGSFLVAPNAWRRACEELAKEFEEKYGPLKRGTKP